MTEREQKARTPTNKDIQKAIEGLASAYHEFVQALMVREDDERQQRRYLRDRLDAIVGTLERMQKQVDRRFDQVWTEVDALKARVDELEGRTDASNAAQSSQS